MEQNIQRFRSNRCPSVDRYDPYGEVALDEVCALQANLACRDCLVFIKILRMMVAMTRLEQKKNIKRLSIKVLLYLVCHTF